MYIKLNIKIPDGKLCNQQDKTDSGCKFKKFLEFGNDYCLIFGSFLKSKTGNYSYNDSYYKCEKCIKSGW